MSDIHKIYQRFLNRQCTPAEVDLLMEHFRQQENATDILNLIQGELDHQEVVIDEQDHISAAHNWSRLESHIHSKSRVRRLQTFWWSAVACLFLLATGAMFYFYKTNCFSEVYNVAQLTEPIKPGSNRAMLTFADGSTVALSPTQGGVVVGETMTYDDGSTIASKKVTYATLATPRGGQYRVTLPDGTKAWLNAASSLQYPTQFDGSERKVTLTGEAYFEVAHNARKPFMVYSGGQRTVVRGTKFNMSAYPEDGKITTTLLEGAVAIQLSERADADEMQLRPDEQAILHNGQMTKLRVDASEAMAWSQGKFMFTDTPLPVIMRQIARWYDVEVVYANPVDDVTFTGSISRFENIQDVLRKLALTDRIKFETQERRIMVKRE